MCNLISEVEAKKKIYNVSCERYFGFGCEIDEETSNKLEGLFFSFVAIHFLVEMFICIYCFIHFFVDRFAWCSVCASGFICGS